MPELAEAIKRPAAVMHAACPVRRDHPELPDAPVVPESPELPAYLAIRVNRRSSLASR